MDAASWSVRIDPPDVLKVASTASAEGGTRLDRARPQRCRLRKNAEGVGEISEARTHPADCPPTARHGKSPPSFPIDPASDRTTECSNLGLANALSCRSGPSHISHDREAITGAMKPDQSMKPSTRSRRLHGDDLALRFALRLLRLRLLCLLRHAALLAEWLATSMKCTIRSCTCFDVLQRNEKNTLSP